MLRTGLQMHVWAWDVVGMLALVPHDDVGNTELYIGGFCFGGVMAAYCSYSCRSNRGFAQAMRMGLVWESDF